MRALLLVMCLAAPGMALAQDRAQSLADIRQELTALRGQIEGLRKEMAPSGAKAATVSGSALQRLDGLEAEVQRLTARTEELGNRVAKVVADGTNRIGDLDFRLTELEGGDVSKLEQTRPLGGDSDARQPQVVPPPAADGMELAVGERNDFDAAKAAVEAGDMQTAATKLERFLGDYPQSPLTADAQLLRGRALTGLGRHADAGRAYLEAFTLTEESKPAIASEGLLGLGQSLATLKQTREACLTLRQVSERFPGTAAAAKADKAVAAQSCK